MIVDTHPLLSIFVSMLIVNGFYNLSILISKTKHLTFLENYAVSGKLISFFLVINFFSIILYNFFLVFGVYEIYLKSIAILIILIGFYRPEEFWKPIIKIIFVNNISKLLFIILFGYFIISLLPITDPDSLDYHLTVPYLSLINEKFFIEKEWLTSQLSGAGEALIIFSLSIKAYKLSSILQFIALFLIIIAVLNLKNNKKDFNLNKKILISLAILCIPSFLFLTLTAKPQLFAIGSNFIAFLMTFFILPFEKNNKRLLTIFSIVSFICLSSTQFKFSFFLSSGIIMLFAMTEMIKRKLFFKSFFISLIFFIIIVCPREYFDYKNLNQDVVVNFFSPVTSEYLTESIVSSLKHGIGNPRYLPYWLFVPYHLNEFSLGAVTEIIGLSVLIFLINFTFKPVKKIIFASLIFFIFAIPYGQSTGRFFIEPFLWLTVGSIYYLKINNNLLFISFKKLLIFNSLIICLVILFTVSNFLPGITSSENHKKILNQYADGYGLYEWANKKLPDDSKILSSHRSFLFSEKKFLSYNFRLYVKTQEELDYFIDLLIKKKPTHILYNGIDHNRKNDVLKNCRGELVAVGKDVYQMKTRNPFNKSKATYNGYIYKIDINKLKKCKIL